MLLLEHHRNTAKTIMASCQQLVYVCCSLGVRTPLCIHFYISSNCRALCDTRLVCLDETPLALHFVYCHVTSPSSCLVCSCTIHLFMSYCTSKCCVKGKMQQSFGHTVRSQHMPIISNSSRQNSLFPYLMHCCASDSMSACVLVGRHELLLARTIHLH